MWRRSQHPTARSQLLNWLLESVRTRARGGRGRRSCERTVTAECDASQCRCRRDANKRQRQLDAGGRGQRSSSTTWRGRVDP